MSLAVERQAWVAASGPDAADKLLVFVFLAGTYLNLEVALPGNLPLPSVVAGMAGLLLLIKHAPQVPTNQAVAGIAILIIAVGSILSAPDLTMLSERFKGLVQFSYSLVISYGFFLVARSLDRGWMARLFLALTLLILLGSALETAVPAFKAASDAFRAVVYPTGLYEADIRDLSLYGRIRPKLFTSEPSFLSFGYTLFAFCWYVLARMKGKVIVYVGLLAAGYVLMRSPTLLMGVGLVPLYEVLLGARRERAGRRRLDVPLAFVVAVVTGFVALAGMVVGWEVLAERIDGIAGGRDPSFFGRIIAPPLVAFETLLRYPLTGVGLTGWEALEGIVGQVYATSEFLAMDVRFEGAAHSLTNYFWALWIFLGLFWGGALVFALSWLLRTMGVPSLLFCWGVWIVFGQCAGGFVSPRTWSVMMLAALVSVLHERAPRPGRRQALLPPPSPSRRPWEADGGFEDLREPRLEIP